MENYTEYLLKKESDYEDLCKRCGACCGALHDPCIHLKKNNFGNYYCDTYDTRDKEHKTVSNKIFRCVPIRNILNETWRGKENCGYCLKIKNRP